MTALSLSTTSVATILQFPPIEPETTDPLGEIVKVKLSPGEFTTWYTDPEEVPAYAGAFGGNGGLCRFCESPIPSATEPPVPVQLALALISKMTDDGDGPTPFHLNVNVIVPSILAPAAPPPPPPYPPELEVNGHVVALPDESYPITDPP
jgi:hypothetical protein